MKSLIYRSTLALTIATSAMLGVVAHAASDLPPVQKSGAVEYLSGGVGLNESKAIREASRQWPLRLEFAVKDKQKADFAANVDVTILDAKNHAALQVKSEGPFLLAKLEPGKYTVKASLAGKTMNKAVAIASGHPKQLMFVWPSASGRTGS